MTKSTREHLTEGSVWLRALFMLLFAVALHIAGVIIVVVVLYQLVSLLFTGKVSVTLLQLGKNLAVYAQEIFEYLTFNSETRPFPFSPWPAQQAGTGKAHQVTEDAESTKDQPEHMQGVLKSCRTCGKDVAESADVCPHCGESNLAPLPLWQLLIAAAGTILVMAFVGPLIAKLGVSFYKFLISL